MYRSLKSATHPYQTIYLFLFSLSVPGLITDSAPIRRQRVFNSFNSLTPLQFSTAFKDSFLYSPDDYGNLSADERMSMIDSICTDILDSIAPFRLKCFKPLAEPWLNESTRALRPACRRAQ